MVRKATSFKQFKLRNMNTNQINNSNSRLIFLFSLQEISCFFFFLFCFTFVSAQTVQNINFPDIPVKGYGDTTFVLNATASSGTVTYTSSNTAVATVSGNIVTIKGVGYSYISAFEMGIGTNASSAPVAQLLVVCPKATLTVKADDKIIASAAAIPTFTYTTSGFKNSQNASVITGTPTLSTTANNLVAGAYPIVINRSTMTATNYEFMMEDGTLTVNATLTKPVFTSEVARLNFFPNPASDFISILNADKATISIVDLNGKTVLNAICNSDTYIMDVTGLPIGIYVARIIKNNEVKNKKFIISR
jgi:hypothetical protein